MTATDNSEWFPEDYGYAMSGWSRACGRPWPSTSSSTAPWSPGRRARIGLLPAVDVAQRAVEIADALVGQFEARGWIRRPGLTIDDEARQAGHLERLKRETEFDELRRRTKAAVDAVGKTE